VNTEDPEVVSTLNEWVKKLVEEYKVDGLRIDTVKHVRKDFWPGFVKSAGVFTLGEVLDEKVNYTAGYLGKSRVLSLPTFFFFSG
jgi:alpha-amylase